MIPPVLVTVKVNRVFIPVPLLLLWPLLAAALVIAQVVLPFVPVGHTTPGQRALMPLAAVRLLGALRGLRVDVNAHDGTGVHIRCW